MQVIVNRKGRKVKLTQTERNLLANAKELCAELSAATRHETAEAFDIAADSIAAGLAGLDALPLVAAGSDL